MYYNYYEYPIWPTVQPHNGMRTSPYQLIHFYYSMDEWELYDIQKDPEEMHNIYGEADELLIADLRHKLDSLQVMYGDTASLEEMRLMTDTVITRVYNEPMKVIK